MGFISKRRKSIIKKQYIDEEFASEIVEIFEEKLNAIGLNNVKIFNDEHDKINRFINENVDYIINDDDLTCIKAAENNIVALFFKNNASNKIENKNVININNWGEVYKFLILNNNL